MRKATQRRCGGCGEEFHVDPRKRGEHWYCAKPECRRASKQASQRRWLQKNPDYFRGPQSAVRQRDRRQRQGEQKRQRGTAMSQDLIDTQVIDPANEREPVTRSDRRTRRPTVTTATPFSSDRSVGGAGDAEEASVGS